MRLPNTSGNRGTDTEPEISPATTAAGNTSTITTTATTTTTITVVTTVTTVATATTNGAAAEATNNTWVRRAVTTFEVVV